MPLQLVYAEQLTVTDEKMSTENCSTSLGEHAVMITDCPTCGFGLILLKRKQFSFSISKYLHVHLAHLSRGLTMWVYRIWDTSRRLSVHVSVCVFTLSNTNISKTSRPIPIKFYLKHHRLGERLVSMVTDSSNRVMIRKMLWPLL